MGDIHITSTLIKKTTLLAPVFSHKNKLYPTCNTVDGVCLSYILNKGSLWYLIISVQIFSFKTEKMLFQPRGANRKLRPFVQGSLLNQSFFGGPIPTHLPSVCSESSTGLHLSDLSIADVLSLLELFYHVYILLGNSLGHIIYCCTKLLIISSMFALS